MLKVISSHRQRRHRADRWPCRLKSIPNPSRLMSILTNRELDFLASLRTDWRRLYWNELARLLREDDTPCDARHGVPFELAGTEAIHFLGMEEGDR